MVYGYNFVQKIIMTQRIEPFLSNVILIDFFLSPFNALSGRFVCINDACARVFRVFGLLVLQVSINIVTLRILQGIANSSGASNFFRAFFMVSSNSMSYGWKK